MRLIIFILFFVITSSCKFTQDVQDGRYAYDLKQYSVASKLLAEEYNQTKEKERKAEIAYYLGKSFKAMNQEQQALKWFEIAVDKKYGKNALIELGYAYKSQENYPAAVKQFEEVQSQYGKEALLSREINICKQASFWVEPNEIYDITIEEESFNSPYADYCPVLYGDQYLLFTSDRDIAVGEDDYKWTGNKFSDILIVNKSGGKAYSFDEFVNTEYNEGTPCFTNDFKQMYFTRCFDVAEGDEYCKLMFSEVVEGEWSEPVVLPFIKSDINYGHPTLLENDSVLVFSAYSFDKASGYDLYYCVWENEEWTFPEAMPNTINTQGDEKFPTSDGDTLYFSSSYLPGLGGLDIFKTYLLKDGRWAPPFNMKVPFNSGSDDFGLVVDRTTRGISNIVEQGYFTSTRNSTQSDQIFSYQKRRKIEIEEEIDNEPEVKADIVPIYLAIRVVENIYIIEDDPNSGIKSKKPLANAGTYITLGNDTLYVKTDEKGRILQEIGRDIDIYVKAKMSGYLSNSKTASSKNIKLDGDEKSHTINMELDLSKLIKNKEIVLENIFYDFDRWDIRVDAKPSLDMLANILKNNPELNILLASHTDCQGNNAYNENLSQKRAQSAIRYLMTVGINPKRLKAKGYGESKLAINCECEQCTEEEHQRNRRTTFTIL